MTEDVLSTEAPTLAFLLAKGLTFNATECKAEPPTISDHAGQNILPLASLTSEVIDGDEAVAVGTVCRAAEQLLLDALRDAPNIVRREEPVGRMLYRQMLSLVELIGHKRFYGPYVLIVNEPGIDVPSAMQELGIKDIVQAPLLASNEALLVQLAPDVARIVVHRMPDIEDGVAICSLTPQVRSPGIAHLRRKA